MIPALRTHFRDNCVFSELPAKPGKAAAKTKFDRVFRDKYLGSNAMSLIRPIFSIRFLQDVF
jgi:hypothetical protein